MTGKDLRRLELLRERKEELARRCDTAFQRLRAVRERAELEAAQTEFLDLWGRFITAAKDLSEVEGP